MELEHGKFVKYLPFAFTEQGVAMLASVLKTEMASKVSVNIMRAFVLMRRYISTNLVEQKYINNQVLKNTEDIKILKETFDEFKPKINSIFYEGQIYDAYSLLMDILNKANNSIIIIDNYAGKELLDILKDINKPITIISKNINETIKNKYLKQYNNITFINNDTFHDRFIIIDNNILFTCGASFKDLGKKCFCLSGIEDKEILNSLLKKI
ncbi:toxin-antitoxin system toxin component Fic family [Firmicutes bacterium CAG:460]|nr:toxin-antitoxin system toxin component Fic family [Firmicutes bacterium CAG:460]